MDLSESAPRTVSAIRFALIQAPLRSHDFFDDFFAYLRISTPTSRHFSMAFFGLPQAKRVA